jgi:nucleotide-binding universal stress UspA family protein
LELAVDMADRYDAKLILLNVIGPGPVPEQLRHMAEVEHIVENKTANTAVLHSKVPTIGVRDNQFQEIQVLESISQILLGQAKQHVAGKGINKIVKVSDHGDPAECILRVANENDVDMILMGGRGLGALKGLVFGSVSSKVQQLAEAITIVVK